jgi:hypothetical protein
MTPRDVDELTAAEYDAFWRYAHQQTKREQREMRRKR